jgi:hypothetical protein
MDPFGEALRLANQAIYGTYFIVLMVGLIILPFTRNGKAYARRINLDPTAAKVAAGFLGFFCVMMFSFAMVATVLGILGY